MSFVSIPFLILACATFVCYYVAYKIVPQYQWMVLLVASVVFYMFASPVMAIYLAGTIVLTWFCAIALKHFRDNLKLKKLILACCLVLNIGTLAAVKYAGFAAEIFAVSVSFKLIVSLGISFYTFSSTAYCVDVYRGDIEPEKNILRYALFISYFPHISQGPIECYSNLAPQLFTPHEFDLDNLKSGTTRALLGLFKKIIIANNLCRFVDSIYKNPEEFSGLVLAFASVMYTLQIYFDFAGYMDIACGVSECMGIKLTENFRTPYFATSVSDFWHRWHMSLNVFFTRYLYIPLGGSRKGSVRTFLNTLIVFAVSGLWHGADWSFVVWGLYHGFFVALSRPLDEIYGEVRNRLHIDEKSKVWALFRIIRTFTIVTIGWIFFRADSISQAILILKRIATKNFYFGWSWGLVNPKFDVFFWVCMGLELIFMLILERVEYNQRLGEWLRTIKVAPRWGIIYALLLPVVYVLLFSNVQESAAGNFIYFNF